MQPNQPNSPQQDYRQQGWPQPGMAQQQGMVAQPMGQSPMGGGWGMPQGKPRTSTPVAVVAGLLALITAGLLVWFAVLNIPQARGDIPWSSLERMNVVGGFGSGALLVLLGVFMFTRIVTAAWFLVVIAVLFAVLIVFLQPLSGVSLGAQLDFVFGFHRTNGVAIGLATILDLLTAIVAAVAGATNRPR